MPLLAAQTLARFKSIASFSAWRERRVATACCERLLEIHFRVAAARPWLTGRALYLHVAAEYLDGDFEQAEQALCAAESSYAIWPTERALTFSDVAHYLAALRCMQAGRDPASLASDIRPTVQAALGRLR